MSVLSQVLSRSTLALGAGVLSVAPAFAYTDFALDRLELEWGRTGNGAFNVSLTDNFDNGNPLTGPNFMVNGATPAGISNYFVTTRGGGAPAAGSESGGKLRFAWDDMLDSTFGGVVTGRSMNYVLGTGTQYTPDNGSPLSNRGLFKANDFRFTTVWDFQLGAENDHIRARLTDAFPNHVSNDLLDLSVWTTGSGSGFQVRQRRLNVEPGSSDENIWSGELGSWLGQFDQIGLTFEHNAGEDFVHTFYSLLSGGAVVYETKLGELTLFNGEDWTRASFGSYALSAPVPEPQTWLLLLAGLGALGVASRRRSQA